MDILKYGADCEVLAPPALRQRVRAEVAKMAARFVELPAADLADPPAAAG